MLSGGGTGGHIYPAIAIANALKQRFPTAEFLFVGAYNRMEMQKVPEAGYAIIGLWISGIQRQLTLKNLSFPFKLMHSLWQSWRILKKFKPHVVIGTGGFASGPLLQMASATRIPSLIQEQNSFPGITNKILAKKVDTICVAYSNLEQYFPKSKLVLTGNPVRQDILEAQITSEDAKSDMQVSKDKTNLLVLGGSLGARRINELIASHKTALQNLNISVVWQCGKLYEEQYKSFSDEDFKVTAFLNKMPLAYAAADIIVSRAGAISVSELCIVGKPVIFIPSPNVAENHQVKNAEAVVAKEAAIMIEEHQLEKEFLTELKQLLDHKDQQVRLGQNIKSLALAEATEAIANEVEKLLPQE